MAPESRLASRCYNPAEGIEARPICFSQPSEIIMSFVRLLCSAMILSASYPVWKAVAEPALRDASAPQIAAVSETLPVELVPTGSSHIVEVTVSHEQDEVVPSDEQLKDSPDGLHLMSPITVSGSVNDWASAGREEAKLPEAEPLEASSVPAVEIKMARLEVDDLISIGSGGLSIEKVMREPLLSSLRVEPIEPIELEYTEISGEDSGRPLDAHHIAEGSAAGCLSWS